MNGPKVTDIQPYRRVGGVKIDASPLLKAGQAIDERHEAQRQTKEENVAKSMDLYNSIDASGLLPEMSQAIGKDVEDMKAYTMENLDALKQGDLSAYNQLRQLANKATQNAENGRKTTEHINKQLQERLANPNKVYDSKPVDNYLQSWKNYSEKGGDTPNWIDMSMDEQYIDTDMDTFKFNKGIDGLAVTTQEVRNPDGTTTTTTVSKDEAEENAKIAALQDPATQAYLKSVAQHNPDLYQKDENGRFDLSKVYDNERLKKEAQVEHQGSPGEVETSSEYEKLGMTKGYYNQVLSRKKQLNALIAGSVGSIKELEGNASDKNLGTLTDINVKGNGEIEYTYENKEGDITPVVSSDMDENYGILNGLVNSAKGSAMPLTDLSKVNENSTYEGLSKRVVEGTLKSSDLENKYYDDKSKFKSILSDAAEKSPNVKSITLGSGFNNDIITVTDINGKEWKYDIDDAEEVEELTSKINQINSVSSEVEVTQPWAYGKDKGSKEKPKTEPETEDENLTEW